MKKSVLTILVLGMIISAKAQISFGAKAGISFVNQKRTEKKGYYTYDTKGKTAFHVGVFGDMQIWNNIYVQPALLYSKKGATHTSSYSGSVTEVSMNYIDAPLNVLYKYPVSFGKIVGGMGPVFSYAFSGKLEQNGKSKKMFSDELKNWKRGDVSANIMAGVELNNGFIANVSYQSGLTDIYKDEVPTIKNRQLTISVGYMIATRTK
jgi:hypothetical protein